MEETKRGRGRPPKSPEDAKPLVYQLRLSESERDAYQQAAERAGVPLAAWIRGCLDRAAKRQSKRD